MLLDPITIDGYSQPGAKPTTKTLQEGNNSVIKIELDGSLLPNGSSGLQIASGQSEVMGLAIHSFYGTPVPYEELLGVTVVAEGGSGIALMAGGSNVIAGNYLGAKANGTVPANPSKTSAITSGISVESANNVIQENIIVGSETAGILIGARATGGTTPTVYGNHVYGNYIGMAKNGRTPLPNHTGIVICWAPTEMKSVATAPTSET